MTVEGPRGALGLMFDRDFGPFFASQFAFGLGMWMFNVTAAVLVFDLTRSAFLVGMVTVGQFVPQVALTPWAGALADRGNRRLQLMLGRLVSAVSTGTLALWLALAGSASPAAPTLVIVTALLMGTGFALSVPAAQSLLPALVRPGELPVAVALNNVPFTAGRAIGPAIGALVAAAFGPPAAMGVTAGVGVLVVLFLVPLRATPASRGGSAATSVMSGLRHVWGDRTVALLLVGVMAISFGVDPVITLTPSLAHALGEGTQFVGYLAAAFGAGTIASMFVIGRLRRRFELDPLGNAGLLVLAGALVAAALTRSPTLALVWFGIGGAGMMIAITALTTLLQERIPEAMRGRIMALWSVAFMGSRPLAATLNGTVTDAFSVQVALMVTGALVVVTALLLRRAPAGRRT